MGHVEGQLDIDMELRVTGTVRSAPGESTRTGAFVETPEQPEPVRVFPESAPVPDLDDVVFAIDGVTATRRSPKLSRQISALVDALTTGVSLRGPDAMSDREVRQWLDDYETIQVCAPAACARLGTEPNPRNATQGGVYAEVIERIVGKRAKPAYRDEPVPELSRLLDPGGLMHEVLSHRPDDESGPEADEREAGNRRAAADAALDTRDRAKVAVARARFLEMYPDVRLSLESRFTE